MSSLKDRLRTDLTSAMKARDKDRAGTLRMVMAAISEAEVAGKEAKELTDDEIITILTREAKKRREAATAFAEGGRTEQAEKETAEAAVITEYLPAQLSAEEISDLVSKAIAQTGAAEEGMRAMGKVMGILTPQTKGRADASAACSRRWRSRPSAGRSRSGSAAPCRRPASRCTRV
ncbi:GatB/YqeY domain-containing protein, partial [Nocardioides sp. NPDC057772]|uniref:GatB/YqeY domain-containing protein n=1 Tax=Nocardioides sp. NPDC057772 TaxID=3346245 RepID=UPI00366EA300